VRRGATAGMVRLVIITKPWEVKAASRDCERVGREAADVSWKERIGIGGGEDVEVKEIGGDGDVGEDSGIMTSVGRMKKNMKQINNTCTAVDNGDILISLLSVDWIYIRMLALVDEEERKGVLQTVDSGLC